MKASAILTLCILLATSCSKTNEQGQASEDDMVLREGESISDSTREVTNWNEVDLESPIVKYDEVTSTEIEVRGTEAYSIYSTDEDILFDFDKASIRQAGEEKLDEIISSIRKRFPNGDVALLGFTDSIGSKSYNKALAEARASSVAEYLRQNSGIEGNRIEILARGEQNPVATNETPRGRQQNRRVEILVRQSGQQ